MSSPGPLPYGRQVVDDDDIATVVSVLKGDWLTQGPAIDQFEDAIRAATGARHAVAFSSGTAALHGATGAAQLGPGDLLATSALSFVASANCARYVGADFTFVDIDPATLNLTIDAIPTGIDALVAVHYAGLPVDMAAIEANGRRPRITIEDAAHALGAQTPDGPVGNCAHSDMCCFSFHPVKPITTAEGGAVTTNDDELAARLRRFRSHGIERPTAPDSPGWVYDVVDLGYNYRLTDLQAALGTSQMTKLDRFIGRRNELAARYRVLMAELPVALPPGAPDGWRHGYHLFALRVPNRRAVYDGLRAAGINAQVHYVPIHHHPAIQAIGQWDLPNTDAAYEQLLSLPLWPELTDADQDRVVNVLARLL